MKPIEITDIQDELIKWSGSCRYAFEELCRWWWKTFSEQFYWSSREYRFPGIWTKTSKVEIYRFESDLYIVDRVNLDNDIRTIAIYTAGRLPPELAE